MISDEGIKRALQCLANHEHIEKCRIGHDECEFYRCGCDKDDIAEEALGLIEKQEGRIRELERCLGIDKSNIE